MAPEVPVLFARWERFTGWLFQRTASFPKRVRHTLTVRVEGLALDVFEAIVEARYAQDRERALARANLDIEKLRLLLRLARDQAILPHPAAEHAFAELDEAGRMVGGWLRHAREAR